jgi:pimeloyl-ACP methyl ester carboxylesterase
MSIRTTTFTPEDPDPGGDRGRAPRPKKALRARRSTAVACLSVLIAMVAAGSAVAMMTGGETTPRMHFNHRMRVDTVCFSVTNPAGSRSVLYGQRYTDGPVSSTTRAIVLVHGIASSTENLDFAPTWSVARALAKAGYVVISYDRLGYAKSSYFDHPGGGLTLTTAVQRDLLHQLVVEVKTGNYTTSQGDDCSAPQQPNMLRNRTVVIIGHSAGGWIVAGYPGKYHDVAAMVQADITGATPLAPGHGGSVTPDPLHPDYFQFFQTSDDCRIFNIDPAGAVPYVARIACTPPFLDSPLGEVIEIPEMYRENALLIRRIGPRIPVLLTSGDNDGIVPPANARADFRYYQGNCGCDVSQLILPDTGHLFMAHRSLTMWLNHVVFWLRSHGITPVP